MFHKFIELSKTRRQPKNITKTSCYKTIRKKKQTKNK